MYVCTYYVPMCLLPCLLTSMARSNLGRLRCFRYLSKFDRRGQHPSSQECGSSLVSIACPEGEEVDVKEIYHISTLGGPIVKVPEEEL